MANDNLTSVVNTVQGLLKGHYIQINEQDGGEKKFCAFEGIPYAEPPLRELRFKNPVPPKCWPGIFKATEKKDCCACVDFCHPPEVVGDEDCLYLNIYTPQVYDGKEENIKSVIILLTDVFTSKTTYNPYAFIKNDVIFVTITYRTGILGFLSFQDETLDIPGNAGLKDILMALQWINKNILRFGGNPKNITLMGVGTAAAHAHLLAMSLKTHDLFHKLILISGSAIVPWTSYRTQIAQIAQKLDYDYNILNIEKQVYEKMEQMGARELVRLFAGTELTFTPPVIEYSKYGILTENPVTLLKTGNFYQTPTIIGCSSTEAILSNKFKTEITADCRNYELFVTSEFNLRRNTRLCKEVGKEIKQFYYGEENPNNNNKHIYYKLLTDIFVFLGIEETTIMLKKKSKKPTYFFHFSTDREWNFYKNQTHTTIPGACYADILGYLFDYEGKSKLTDDSIEMKIYNYLTTFFANFAKNNDPNPVNNDDSIITTKWHPVTKKDFNYLEIKDSLSSKINPDRKTCDFWNNLRLTVLKQTAVINSNH